MAPSSIHKISPTLRTYISYPYSSSSSRPSTHTLTTVTVTVTNTTPPSPPLFFKHGPP